MRNVSGIGGPVVAIALAAAAVGSARAEIPCAGRDTTQAGMLDCVGAEYEKTDAELNRLFKAIQLRIGNDKAKARLFVTSQRAWIAFRDADCAFTASALEGGTAQPTVETQCLSELTAKRSGDLKRYLACAEGDLACPVPPAR